MFYRRQGRGEPVLLLHGFASSSLFWAELADRLGSRFDVIAPDWPGFGQSQGLAPYTNLDEFAAGVIQLADRLGLGDFHVVGHSMSGFVVQALLHQWPDRIKKAVLYGAGLSVNKARRFESIAQTLDRLRTDGPQLTSVRVIQSWFADIERDRHAYQHCLKAACGMTLAAASAAVQAMEQVDFSCQPPPAAKSVLVLAGEAERSHPPASALELSAALPGAHLGIVPFCGHAAHLEQPELFYLMVKRFLGS